MSGTGSGRVNIHSKQLCVPLRIFLRIGSDSSFGILGNDGSVLYTQLYPPVRM
jgi:hypothetical protein